MNKYPESYMVEVHIGDYSVNIWKPATKTIKQVVKETIGHSISAYGLKVVEA